MDRAAAVVGVRDRYHAGCHRMPDPDEEAPWWAWYPRITDRSQPRVLLSATAPAPNSDNRVPAQGCPARRPLTTCYSLYGCDGSHASALVHRRLSGTDVVPDEGRHSTEERFLPVPIAAATAPRRAAYANAPSAGLTASAHGGLDDVRLDPLRLTGWRRRGDRVEVTMGINERKCATYLSAKPGPFEADEPSLEAARQRN